MKNTMPSLDAGQKYAAAYAVHYGQKNLGEALALYVDIRASDPESLQAGYAQSQIQNIARAVVPKQDLLDAQVDLVRDCLREHGATP